METRFLDQKIEMEKCEEGQEIFDLKPLTKEECLDIEVAPKPIVAGGGELLDFKGKILRGQRRKLQLYGDKGERES